MGMALEYEQYAESNQKVNCIGVCARKKGKEIMTIPQQLLALSRAPLRERSRALLGPLAAKKTTAEQRDALAACYEDNPQLCRSLRAPKIDDDDYDEILAILRGLSWDRLSRRGGVAATRL